MPRDRGGLGELKTIQMEVIKERNDTHVMGGSNEKGLKVMITKD